MNVNPSDTDVRQGYALAENVTTTGNDAVAQSQQATAPTDATTVGTTGRTDAPPAEEQTDKRSKAAQNAADKTAAREAAARLDEQFQNKATGLKIRVLDDSAHTIQVEVVDTKSNKVLRQIPQDEMLKISASMRKMTGVLVNKPA